MWFANRNREKNIRMSYELTWVYGGGLVLKWWYFLALESVMLRREREVNPRTCVPPKANEAVPTLDGPQPLRYRQAQARAHKNKPVLHRMPDQGNKLHLQAGPICWISDMENHSWVSTARLSNPVHWSDRISSTNKFVENGPGWLAFT
jgi:hypothetical protein